MRIHGMDAIFNPRSVAVIGASSDPKRIGGRPVGFLKRHGFAGPILPINPKSAKVQGLPAYPSLAEVAPSHTASLAGAESLMRPSVNTAFAAPDPVDKMFDVTYACSLMNGDRLGLVTVSGGVGVLMAQEAEEVRSGRVVSCTEKAQGSSDLRGRAKPCGRDGAPCERDRLA